jgi:hypothetical protein
MRTEHSFANVFSMKIFTLTRNHRTTVMIRRVFHEENVNSDGPIHHLSDDNHTGFGTDT